MVLTDGIPIENPIGKPYRADNRASLSAPVLAPAPSPEQGESRRKKSGPPPQLHRCQCKLAL